jgi:hypothetical protein
MPFIPPFGSAIGLVIGCDETEDGDENEKNRQGFRE